MENTKKHSNRNFKKALALFVLVFVGILPIICIVLPANYFDGKESICLSHLIFQTECYACGMTKAIQHLIHFEINTALKYNFLSIVVLPLIAYLWLKNVYILFTNHFK